MKTLLNYNAMSGILTSLQENFNNDAMLILPIKVNYAIQRNLKKISEYYETFEESKIAIGKKYGELIPESNSYKIPPENMAIASKELENLANMEENIDIKKISLADLEDIKLSSKQMASLLFMIEEE